MGYAELLKDPRWQKRRLEIMERDNWTCQECSDTESTLTTHHKSYRKVEGIFVDVWDYPDTDLITLCDTCHSKEELNLKEIQRYAYFQLRDVTENVAALRCVVGMVNSIARGSGGRASAHDILLALSVYDKFIERLQDNNSRWFSSFVDKVNERHDEAMENYKMSWGGKDEN